MRFLPFLSKMVTALCILLLHNVLAQDPGFIMSQIGPDYFLDTPWDLDLAPDGYLWVTERKLGFVSRIDPETAEKDVLLYIADNSSTAGQDGLLGMAIDDGLLEDSPYVYLSYTHLVQGQRKQKLVRYTYTINGNDGSLSDPVTLIDNLPCSNDHNSGRLIIGPDGKIYYTIGDQGANQGSNYCKPNLAQTLPTQEEVDEENWSNYPGKVLRLNTDGSIPGDNPVLNGVRSHIFSFGHRNAQGISFASNGLLYADEHGPNTDDEVNIILSGKNYGWPRVVGFLDDQAYDYCNWSSADNCQSLSFSTSYCPPSAIFLEESTFSDPNYHEPLFSMFAVPDDYDYNNPACEDTWICRPNVAPSSIAIYESDAIPEWKNSVLVASLKRGRVFRLKLDAEGTSVIGDTTQHFYTQNRYRDIVVDPDGKSFYMITDVSGKTSGPTGLTVTTDLQNPGALLKFTLEGSSSVQNLYQNVDIRVWPNPASGEFSFDLPPGAGTNISAELINTSGHVLKKMHTLNDGIHVIDTDDLPGGIYFLRLSSTNRAWYSRIVLL